MLLLAVFGFFDVDRLDYAVWYEASFVIVGSVNDILCGSYDGNVGPTDVVIGPILWAVSGSVVGMALAVELSFTLPGGFGAGYSSMRIHLPPFAMRVAKFSSVLSLPGGFISGLMSSLTSGSTIASIPGVFFRVVATGVGRGACCCPFLLPCTRRFLGLGPVSVVTP